MVPTKVAGHSSMQQLMRLINSAKRGVVAARTVVSPDSKPPTKMGSFFGG
jgi:hypothetical protein